MPSSPRPRGWDRTPRDPPGPPQAAAPERGPGAAGPGVAARWRPAPGHGACGSARRRPPAGPCPVPASPGPAPGPCSGPRSPGAGGEAPGAPKGVAGLGSAASPGTWRRPRGTRRLGGVAPGEVGCGEKGGGEGGSVLKCGRRAGQRGRAGSRSRLQGEIWSSSKERRSTEPLL